MAAGDISKALLAVVQDRLGDVGGTTWNTTALYGYLTYGQMTLAECLCDAALYPITKVVSTALTDDVYNYDLPSDFLRERLVNYKGKFARRWKVEELDSLRANALTTPTEANPFYYLWGGDIWFVTDEVVQSGSDVFLLWYIRETGTISASADPDLPTQYYGLLEDFAVARALELSGERQEAEFVLSHFNDLCSLINERYAGASFDWVPVDPGRLQ